MITFPDCPVCSQMDWETLSQRTYRVSEMPDLSEYMARRYRVLFEIWAPGESKFTVRSQLCRQCGFIVYTPRPTADELDRKYRFLGELGHDTAALPADAPIELARAKEAFRQMTWGVRAGKKRVLDFGGGDGRLIAPLVARGWDCSLVDYTPHTIAGVRRLGSTLADLNEALRFDLIVCSHVLEHLADPLETVVALRRYLEDSGTLYVEVPMEIWRRPPLQEEPVTHVNFFTVDSLRFLLQRCGYCILRVRMGSQQHPSGRRATVIRAWARPSTNLVPPKLDQRAAERTRRLLSPGWSTRIAMLVARPDRLLSRFRAWKFGSRQ